MNRVEQKLRAIELIDQGYGYKSVAAKLGVSRNRAREWLYAYRALGKEALVGSKHKTYSQELKLEAVRLFLDEGLTKAEIMERMGIKSLTSLERWIRGYRKSGPGALAPKPRGRAPKPEGLAFASREEELEARVRELELELEIQKRINALADEIERRSHRR